MTEEPTDKETVREMLIAKAEQHATLTAADNDAIRKATFRIRSLATEEDVVRQGERPDSAVFISRGMLARYHTLPDGDRQYLSFHIAGDMPDVQSLFLKVMDHSVSALMASEIAMFDHRGLTQLFARRPGVAFAFWRLTLVDAAIFRQAITNNSARDPPSRLAHLCCEQFYRAREAGIAAEMSCDLPLNQTQLSQTLGMSHITVHRALQSLRRDRLLDLRGGKLQILDWGGLVTRAGFDPTYLHIAKESAISARIFRGQR
ncbi:MAG: Crp/Fnr family transcriptional regulator [Hyphomicrobiaceae bacterium]|nr:Crp/Fnr family transcriptional regulator [Hyphomicrobiaceae bacterium]